MKSITATHIASADGKPLTMFEFNGSPMLLSPEQMGALAVTFGRMARDSGALPINRRKKRHVVVAYALGEPAPLAPAEGQQSFTLDLDAGGPPPSNLLSPGGF